MRTVLAALLVALVLPLAACDSGSGTDTALRLQPNADQTVEVFARRDTVRLDVTTLFQAFNPSAVSLALSADTAAHATLSGTTLKLAPINEGAYVVDVIARPQGGEQSSAKVTVQARADWCTAVPQGKMDVLPYQAGETVRFGVDQYSNNSDPTVKGVLTWQITARECLYGATKLSLIERFASEGETESSTSLSVLIPANGKLPPIGQFMFTTRYMGVSLDRFITADASGAGISQASGGAFRTSYWSKVTADAQGIRAFESGYSGMPTYQTIYGGVGVSRLP